MKTEDYIYILKVVKIYILNYFTFYTSKKIIYIPKINNSRKIYIIIELILAFVISGVSIFIESKSNRFYSIIYLIIFYAILISKFKQVNLGYALIINLISLGINYVMFSFSVILCGIFTKLFGNLNNIYVSALVFLLYIFLLKVFLSNKKFKNGFAFVQKNIKDDNFDNIILNISIIVIFLVTFISYVDFSVGKDAFIAIILISIIMFITISKSFQLYYKHRLLMKELDRLNAEIEDLNKNNKELETENIEINKINHTLSHKQKALEHKINKFLMNTEIAKEITPVEEKDIKEKLEDISKEVYKEKAIVTLKKTEIPNIDNMLEFLQEECTENKIEFELQILGNIFYMTNHYITKEDLEILIADHVKDAIIAVNHSDNEYRSILVRLGKIDNIYSLYIYDSGIEFEEETLNNLGKKPCTTHAEEGGSGLGFMNTFDTLRKYKASLTIKEISKPTKENYTKIIIIKFDGLNEFTIDSYKKQQNVKIKN